MSTLNPRGVDVDVMGRHYEILFTLNAIDKIQDMTGKMLPEIMLTIADVKNPDSIPTLKLVLSILLSDYSERIHDPLYRAPGDISDIIPISEKQVGQFVTAENWGQIIEGILTAYGYSMPEKSEDEEESDPNLKSGNS